LKLRRIISCQFTDANGLVHGSTSIAVETQWRGSQDNPGGLAKVRSGAWAAAAIGGNEGLQWVDCCRPRLGHLGPLTARGRRRWMLKRRSGDRPDCGLSGPVMGPAALAPKRTSINRAQID
jgi:hypothetical protein